MKARDQENAMEGSATGRVICGQARDLEKVKGWFTRVRVSGCELHAWV